MGLEFEPDLRPTIYDLRSTAMKLKRLPEDFQVDERTAHQPAEGPFALYRLTKRGLGTLEAVAAVGRRWKIPPGRIAWGGLKDRHAVTTSGSPSPTARGAGCARPTSN